jgi:hypothetical protein
MAQTIYYFDSYKVWNTTRDEYVVYVLSQHWSDGVTCVPNPNAVVFQCAYMQGPEPIWMDTTPDLHYIPSGAQLIALEAEYGPLPAGCTPGTSGPCLHNVSYPSSAWHMHNMFYPHTDLQVGDWLTYKDNPSGCFGNSNQQCYKVLAVVTEAEWGNQCTECADYYLTTGSVGGPAGSVATCNGVAGGPCYNTLASGGNPPIGGPRHISATSPYCPNGAPLGEGDMLNYIANDCDECTYTWNPPPTTYNCELNTQWDPNCYGCYDPGDGTGQFTNATATNAGFANPLLECQDYCECPTYYSCTTTGCSMGYYPLGTNPPAGTYPTQLECQAECVGWGCTSVNTLSDFYLYVYYDMTSMGVEPIKVAYSAVTDWVQSLAIPPNGVFHVVMGDEEWLRWAAAPYMDQTELANLGQQGWGNQSNKLPLIETYFDELHPMHQVGTWHDNIDSSSYAGTFPDLPLRNHSDKVLNLMFIDETHNHGGGGYFEGNAPSSLSHPYFANLHAGTIEPSTPFKNDYNFYVDRYKTVETAGGNITSFIYPTPPDSQVGLYPAKQLYTHTALHFVASIDSGNQDQTSGTGTLDGTWQTGTSPVCTIANLHDLELSPNPYYDELNSTSSYSNNYGGLDQFGWGYNVNFATMNGVTLSNDLNTFISNSASVTITTTFSICTSAETVYQTSPSHSSATEYQCWIDCEITGYTCTDIGCIYGIGTEFLYDSLDDCYSGTSTLPACTSYNCVSTGCTLYNEFGTSQYTGSGNLGSGGTHTTLNACLTLGCTSYDCDASGCTQYNISAGTASYINGSGGTGGAFTTSNCDGLCSSFDCTDTGCEDYNISAGTASYNLFAGSVYQGYGGSGGTYLSTVECSGVCKSYECTDYGCVLYNDSEQAWAPGYVDGTFGSGGTFSSLATCTAACQSFGCEVAGCEDWNSPNNQNSFSYLDADVIHDLGGNYGTGGSATLAACTGECFTWGCTDTGCTATTGFNINAWQYNQETQCNQFCSSHNCADNGCVPQPGSGGTFFNAVGSSLSDCQNGTATLSACTSWECDPLPGNNGGITLSTVYGTGGFNLWNQDPCTSYPGSGGTFSSLNDCNTGCTSWSCQYPGNYYVYPTTGMISYNPLNGCLQFGNTGNTYSQLTYAECLAQEVCVRYECTDNGCIVGDPVTGTYDSLDDCTGGTATLKACQSWNCTEFDGCEVWNGPNSSVPNYVDGGYGTGGTNQVSLADCDLTCVSYSCTTTGCTEQPGYGGPYYNQNDPTVAAAMCQANCFSYFCTDDGCEVYNSPGSVSYINGFSGSGGTYIDEYDCDIDCVSWNCDDNGCVSQDGTGGTFTTKALCTATCQSFVCATTGCTGYNDPLYPNSPLYIDGEYGTGGTYTLSAACTASCISYNCTINGCVATGGTQGAYADLTTCNTACSSWDCLSSGCTEYNISAGTPSYTTGSGGTGGTYFNSSCDNECSSWDCTNSGCTEYNVSANTASYNLFTGSVFQGHGGTGGTYFNSTCDDFCYSYECLEVETPTWNGNWNQDGCVQQVGTGSTYYSGIGSLAGVVDSYTACTAQCRSWSCENPDPLVTEIGCLEYPNTGITNTFTSLVACTAETICKRYDCTDYGCVIGDHITGSYGSYDDCEAACTSFTCTNTACLTWNDSNAIPSTYIQGSGGGTGGTFTNDTCDNLCTSYNCLSTYDFNNSGTNELYNWDGCQQQDGSGGTYFNTAGDSYSLSDCNTGCTGWSCENTLAIQPGCINYPNTGSTTQIMYGSLAVCTAQTICDRYDCTPVGCVSGSQVTGDFASFDECTGGTAANNYADACQSWSCLSGGTYGQYSVGAANYFLMGCEVFNGPNSSGVTSAGILNYVVGPNYGTYGSGGENQTSLFDCNINCKSWNCLDAGCTEQVGYGGAYDNDTCSTINGVQNICQSYECDPYSEWNQEGCSIYPGSGGTFFNAGGLSLALDMCESACTSWSCQNPLQTNLGCFEYPNTGNTLTQPTYSACTAETVCWRYECTANGCVFAGLTGGTYDSYNDCTGGTATLPACQSWQCTDDGCEEYNSPSYPSSWHNIDSTYGTGGTSTISLGDCNQNCRSYSCEDYGCEQHGGTGNTYVSTVYANEYSVWLNCADNCKSWSCIDVGLDYTAQGCNVYNQIVPPAVWVEGGNNGFGTGGTYTSTTSCSSACTSWRCQDMGTLGCTQFFNTANTYSTYTSCTANTECKHYDCDVTGCIEILSEYQGGIDSYETISECRDGCIGWACVQDLISTGSSIYVYYDISNMSFNNVKNKRNELKNYMNSQFPTFAGNVYHTIVSDGRWLDWANSVYSGEFSVPPTTASQPWEPASYQDERALLAIEATASIGPGLAGDWYDQYSAGTYTNIGIMATPTSPSTTIPSLTTHGPAPTANTSNSVVIISFITESDGLQPNVNYPVYSSSFTGYHEAEIPFPSVNWYPVMLNQPTQEWKEDYTAYTANYTTVSANSGTIRAVLYPIQVPDGTITNNTNFGSVAVPNYSPATVVNQIGNAGDSTKMCLLQSFAAISSGNQITPDGTWLPNTAPRPSWQGGALGNVPELCYTSLQQLEGQNPYWTNTVPTWGGLDMSGWTVNIEGAYLGSTDYTGFLNNYLNITTTLTAGTCTSAETLYTANVSYPLSSETECDLECLPTMYLCTVTGCTLSWEGYLTLTQCTNQCKSVSCTDDGCEWYNASGTIGSVNYSNGLWGSGGTWNHLNTPGGWSALMLSCQTECISSTCNGYPNNLTQQGCIQQVGTGGTFTGIGSYSACTGTCKSWLCDDPCVTDANNISIGVGCIEYPNTGATYTSSTACTAQCQENWYCLTGLTGSSSCTGLIDTGIVSSDIADHIDIIQTTTAWNGLPFQSFKFILNNTFPYPATGCYDLAANGYFVKLNSIQVEVTVGGLPTSTYTFINWNDLLATMNGTAGNPGILVSPMTTIDDLLNLGSNLVTTFNWEYCDCFTSSCSIGCENTSTLPVNAASGRTYPTYLSAQTSCCPTTWSCSANTVIDNCDALSTLPGIFLDVQNCYDYMAVQTGLPYLDFTTWKCEISPTSVLANCEIGPNGGELVRLTGIQSTIPAISSNVYTSWNSYVAALTGLSPTVSASVYSPLTVIQAQVWQVYTGTSTTYGSLDCECDNPYTCECIEVSGPDGTYTSQTQCEETCCSSTTWNCVQNQPYLPICGNKQYLGAFSNELQILDYYRANSPTSLFGLDKWVMFGPPSFTQSEVNSLPGNWQDCFEFMDIDNYLPYSYLYNVSHELISGGTKYQTWYEFYNAVDSVVTACTPSDSAIDINNKINSHFGVTIFELELGFRQCCSKEPCYCYDTLGVDGDYASETLCDTSCCPPNYIDSWSCELTTNGFNSCQYGPFGAESLDSAANGGLGQAGYGPWSSYQKCVTHDLTCAKSWICSVPSGPPPCFGEPCTDIPGHHSVTNAYPTQLSCETNTNLDCCGPEYLWKCMSSETTTTFSGLTDIPDNFGTLGYHTSDDVLTYLADPTASPTRQYSGITAFTFCNYETDTTVLNAADESCKCGDGCDGILHSSDYIVFNNLATGAGSNGLPYHPATNQQGYCTTWVDMITQLNGVWDTTGLLNVNLNMTFHDVVTATTNTLGQVITISTSGLESCVDTTGPCSCEPCYTPHCGTSLKDCEDTCCQPVPTTWTCTPNGCMDVCNGEGEFSSYSDCKVVCYEWGCMDDVWGCTDSGATNYNSLATIDDGTCLYPTNRWSCSTGHSCSDKTIIVDGGLSFTAAIYVITANHHDVEFNTIKFTLGGGNNQMQSPEDIKHQLPTQPCEHPCSPPSQDCVNGIATWGQPGPYYAYIKYVMYSGLPGLQFTTWKSFIDAINSLGYTFPYFTSPSNFGWQDLEAVLGANQLHCEWTWCDCGGCHCIPDANGPYISELGCDSDTTNCCESWKCETTYDTNTCSGKTDIGFTISVLYPHQPLEFMVNNGYQFTDVDTLKFIFNNPAPSGICTINNNTQHWSHYISLSVGSSVTPLGSTIVQSWSDALTWLNTNYNLGLLTTMSYQDVMDIISQPSVGKYIYPDLGVCYCTGIECECVEVFDGSGLYSSSGECSTAPNSCCTLPPPIPETYDCDCTGTTTTTNDSCASYIDAGIGSFFVDAQSYFDFINVNFGASADVSNYKYHKPCNPPTNFGTHCPVPNQVGMCYAVRIYWQTSYFGNPANLVGGKESPDFTTFQQIVDWFNLVATTEGYAGGFNTSMTIADMMTLAVSQNTYTTQDYCNAGPTTPWGCTNQVPPAMGSGGGGSNCSCAISSTVGCHCIDPGDGSGMYTSLSNCESDAQAPCYTGTASCSGGINASCIGTTYIPDNNFESYLESHMVNQFPTAPQGIGWSSQNNVTATWPNTMGNGVVGDNYVQNSNICCTYGLNVSYENISDLTGIEGFTKLRYLNCSSNQLTSLDISNNADLTYLYCKGNQLPTLFVGNNNDLRTLDCQYNQLTTLNVTTNTNLVEYRCAHNNITSIDVSQNLILTNLGVSHNPINNLDVSNNLVLKSLYCAHNQLTNLDVSVNTDLTTLNYANNDITSQIDISNNLLMEVLYTSDNPINSLDVSLHINMLILQCTTNQLTSINLINNTLLGALDCRYNQITSLDLTVNTSLYNIKCDNNNMSHLYLGSVLDLNGIQSFSAIGNPNLTIHVGTTQRVADFQAMFVTGTHYDVGTNIAI